MLMISFINLLLYDLFKNYQFESKGEKMYNLPTDCFSSIFSDVIKFFHGYDFNEAFHSYSTVTPAPHPLI